MTYFRRVLNRNPLVITSTFFCGAFFAISVVQLILWSVRFEVCK
ncbi:hypothetical protein RCH06_001933 [Polaromonas sp. CG_9.5]|nr:hypothetical protein [Polaromonas sp. CG_9.5]